MKKEICFDMDGTIADLYGQAGWLDDLDNERVDPYKNARPLVNMQALARVLNNAQRKGYKLVIISWLSKFGSADYNARVAQVKRDWLAKHLASVKWDAVNIVAYGEAKSQFGDGILFDDEQRNRDEWGEGAYGVDNIIGVIRGLA